MNILRLTKAEAFLDSQTESIPALARKIGVEPDWLKCIKNRKMKDPGTNKVDLILFYARSQGWKYEEQNKAA